MWKNDKFFLDCSPSKPGLLKYRKNFYSENGEDGVILEILNRLDIQPEMTLSVEFGAWDGVVASNTFNLVKKGASAIMIEGDADKFKLLMKTASEYPKICPVNAFVNPDRGSSDCLNEVLRRIGLEVDPDLLSIDIDSNDLEVWASLTGYRPKIVVIEINSSIPPGMHIWHNSRVSGNSFSATLAVGSSKLYTLVCHTGNMIFVRDDLVNKIGLPAIDLSFPERLFIGDWLPRR